MSASINPKFSQKKEKNVKKAILTKEKLQDLDISDEEALSDLMDNQSEHSIEEEEIQKEQKETDEIPLEEPDYEQEEPKDSTAIEKFMKDNAQKLDLTVINNKIQDILNILNNFTANRDQARSRESYVSEFAEYLCAYYGYNRELIDIFLMTFSANECIQFLDANDQPRPITIRTNTLKTKRKDLAQTLIQRGVNLDPLAEWTKVGLKIYESKVPLGATPEYLAGFYMLQAGSSLLPVMALAPQSGERILDMSAAPGGKTTYIAQLMRNTGVLFANDLKKDRLKALKFNLQRMGVTNSVVTNYDGRKFPKVMKNFDRILLDAPCTGLGIISKDPSIKTQKGLRDVRIASHLQKELILAAIDCLKKGGFLVYSTCSVTVQENEWVIDYAISKRHVKVVPTGLEIGEDGITKWDDKRFHPSIKLSKRIYPHIHNMDGFFVCKLKKIENGNKTEIKTEPVKEKKISLNKKIKKNKKKKERKMKKLAEEKEKKEKEAVGGEEDKEKNAEKENLKKKKKKNKNKIDIEKEDQTIQIVEKDQKIEKKEKKEKIKKNNKEQIVEEHQQSVENKKKIVKNEEKKPKLEGKLGKSQKPVVKSEKLEILEKSKKIKKNKKE